MIRWAHVHLDVIEGYVGRGASTQSFPGFHAIQELLDLINVVFCRARMVDHVVDVLSKCLALALELLELDGGDELESLAERGGTSAVEIRR